MTESSCVCISAIHWLFLMTSEAKHHLHFTSVLFMPWGRRKELMPSKRGGCKVLEKLRAPHGISALGVCPQIPRALRASSSRGTAPNFQKQL